MESPHSYIPLVPSRGEGKGDGTKTCIADSTSSNRLQPQQDRYRRTCSFCNGPFTKTSGFATSLYPTYLAQDRPLESISSGVRSSCSVQATFFGPKESFSDVGWAEPTGKKGVYWDVSRFPKNTRSGYNQASQFSMRRPSILEK